MKKYKYTGEALKRYRITQKMVSEWSNYSSPDSFYNSSARYDVLRLVEHVISHIEGYSKETVEPEPL